MAPNFKLLTNSGLVRIRRGLKFLLQESDGHEGQARLGTAVGRPSHTGTVVVTEEFFNLEIFKYINCLSLFVSLCNKKHAKLIFI